MKKRKSLFSIWTAFCVCLTGAVLLTACKGDTHKHEYASEWTCDATHHYHACVCGAKEDKAEHVPTMSANTGKNVCEICGWTIEKQSGLTFKTLTVNGTKVSGEVSNTTAEFSFIDEVSMDGDTSFIVDNNKDCSTPIASKTVDLKVGDNTFYLVETVGNQTTLYTVTIRRRAVFTVSFVANGGTAVQPQTVEEGGLATPPTTEREGYTFNGWDYDFTKPITENVTVTASWKANTNTPYRIEYYLQNAENDGYTLYESVDKTGTTGATVRAENKSFETHKLATETLSDTVKPDGSLVIKVYYDYKTYTVNFLLNGGLLNGGAQTQTVKHGQSATAPACSRFGYTFVGWDKTFANVTSDLTVTAGWGINTYQITYDLAGGTLAGAENPKAYTVETVIPLTPAEKEYYEFLGWYDEKGRLVTSFQHVTGNLNLTAKWESIFLSSGSVFLGLTEYGTKTYAKIEIPAQIGGHTITSIYERAFAENTVLKEIVLPDAVTEIQREAFNGCTALEKVTFPKSLETLEIHAFLSCSALSEAILPEKVRTISYNAFAYCHSLKSISIPASVTTIEQCAFMECYGLENIYYDAYNCTFTDGLEIFYKGGRNGNGITVTFGKHVTKIPDYIFCPNRSTSGISPKIKKVGFEEGSECTAIGQYAFYYCTALEEVEWPKDLTTVGVAAFSRCKKLQSVEFGDKTAEILNNAFSNCEIIKTLHIPASVKTIENGAFANCLSLERVTMEEGVTKIGESAFYNCTALTSAEIPNSVQTLGNSVFQNCPNLQGNEKDGICYIGNKNNPYMLLLRAIDKEMTEAKIADTCTTISNGAFNGCALIAVYVPKSVTVIGNSFEYCSKITDVYYAGTEEEWEKVSVDSWNYYILQATKHYNSQT